VTDSSVPLRVLHLCLSQSWGGLEMYPARVTPELQRQGWAVHGMALAGTRVADAFKAVGVEPLTVGSRPAALLQLPRILRYLDRHDIRVVHAHKSSDMQIAALLAQWRPGLRLFFTDHMGVKKAQKGSLSPLGLCQGAARVLDQPGDSPMESGRAARPRRAIGAAVLRHRSAGAWRTHVGSEPAGDAPQSGG